MFDDPLLWIVNEYPALAPGVTVTGSLANVSNSMPATVADAVPVPSTMAPSSDSETRLASRRSRNEDTESLLRPAPRAGKLLEPLGRSSCRDDPNWL